MNRKHFLKTTCFGSVGAMLLPSAFLSSCKKHDMDDDMMARPVYVTEGDFASLLPLIAYTDLSVPASLTVQSASADIFQGAASSVLGYNGGILGPAFRAQNGQTVNINFQNNLSEATNIHWHGLLIPADMDGHPEDIISAGGSKSYSLPLNQRAGMYWFHPHLHETTGRQVFKGMAGLFVINDAEEAGLNLPSGDYEIPLVIQDKRNGADNSLPYNPALHEVMSGYMGQYVCVNGKYSPYLNVATRFYRFRILNGSNARIFNLALSNNASFYVIGSDGGLLSSPHSVSSVLLSHGERLDVLIDFYSYNIGAEIFLQSNTFSGSVAQGVQSFSIMKFKVAAAESDGFTVPGSLSNIAALSAPANTRTFDISNQAHGGGHGGHGGGGMMTHTINNKTFDMNRIDETVNAGATEAWVFDNGNGDEPHPMHIHGVLFQVTERTGGRGVVLPHEGGWKDTVLVMPKEKVKVLMQFTSNLGKFVFHCHNLEHEDSGMMLNYEIV